MAVAFDSSFDLTTLGTSVAAQIAAVGSNPVVPASIGVDRITLTTVPIPAAVWMFGSALGLLGWMRRKETKTEYSLRGKNPTLRQTFLIE
jgi:hypothetical protein